MRDYSSENKWNSDGILVDKAGTPLDDFDLLIGTTALANALVLVTNNEAHMRRISGIQIENWTK